MYGDSLRDFIVGFLSIDPERVKKYADEQGKAVDDNLMADAAFK